ncbi:MAG: hypothetical protein Q4G39_07655, partial [Brachymonas sp.]|nr:hypothetical protein [Brachymonas sp.]
MTECKQPESPMHEDELVALYQQATQWEGAEPGEGLRARVLAAARQAAEGSSAEGVLLPAQHDVDAAGQGTTQAANDARWKIRALGSLAVLGLVGLLAYRFMPNTPGYAELARTAPAAPYEEQASSATAPASAEVAAAASAAAPAPTPAETVPAHAPSAAAASAPVAAPEKTGKKTAPAAKPPPVAVAQADAAATAPPSRPSPSADQTKTQTQEMARAPDPASTYSAEKATPFPKDNALTRQRAPMQQAPAAAPAPAAEEAAQAESSV